MDELKKKIAHSIANCFARMDSCWNQCTEIQAYKKEVSKLSEYTEEAKALMINRRKETVVKSAKEDYNAIEHEIENIRKAAAQLNDKFSITPELQSAVQMVNTMGDKLPVEVRAYIVNSFAGEQKSLKLIKSLFERMNISTSEINRLIFDINSYLDKTTQNAYQIVMKPGESFMGIINTAKDLEEFADRMGVELNAKFDQITDISGYYTRALREAAGLGVKDLEEFENRMGVELNAKFDQITDTSGDYTRALREAVGLGVTD